MLSLCFPFLGTGLPAWEKFNSNMVANGESRFSDFYLLINLVKRESVAFTNAYNSSGLIKLKEKI